MTAMSREEKREELTESVWMISFILQIWKIYE